MPYLKYKHFVRIMEEKITTKRRAIYKIYFDGILLYIGSSENVYRRIKHHYKDYGQEKHQKLLKRLLNTFYCYNVPGISIAIIDVGKKKRIEEEVASIIRENPVFNVQRSTRKQP